MSSPANSQKLVNILPEQLKDLGDYALGLKLLIKCREATYIGICSYVLHESRQITLEQVSVVTTGKSRFGLLIVFYQDILSINIIGIDSKTRKRLWREIYGVDKKPKTLLMKQILAPSLLEEQLTEISEDLTEEEISLLPHFTSTLLRPTQSKIIDEFGDEFNLSLCDLKNEKIISVFGCGLKFGRRGTLAWLCLGTSNSLYLFDVAKLDAQALLKSELGGVLSNEHKIKVVHDGRKLEDYLFHQHNLNLKNVFDTQASSVYLDIVVNGRSDIPLLVQSLPSLMHQHLKFETSDVANLFPDIADESMWLERPLPQPLIVFLIHSIAFLSEIRDAMMKVFLTDLESINRIFLSSLRDKPPGIVGNIEEQIVPPEIRNVFKQSLISKSLKINYVQSDLKHSVNIPNTVGSHRGNDLIVASPVNRNNNYNRKQFSHMKFN